MELFLFGFVLKGKKLRHKNTIFLGVNSPFVSTIVLFKNQLFPLGFDGFLKRRDHWKEWKFEWKVPWLQ